MNEYKITQMHTGKVRIEPELAFGGDHCSTAKASGFSLKRSPRIWLPVSAFLVETPKGLLLLDTGWSRSMSPNGVLDRKAQIKSLGSWPLYHVNQGVVPIGMTASEQLERIGVKPSEIDYVIISHFDCDHANGLEQFKDAKHIMVARDEYNYAIKHHIRFNKSWWKDVKLDLYNWNDNQGPFGRSYDLYDDKSVELINIPGHTAGLVATKITNLDNEKYFLYYGDGGYGDKSWKEMITSGISMDKASQKKSLEWIRKESMNPNCVESLACHGAEDKPHTIEF